MVSARHIGALTGLLKVLRVALILALPAPLWLLRSPPSTPSASTALSDAPTVLAARETHDLDWYAPLWRRDLKQPPIPQTAPAAVPESIPESPLPALLATLVEPQARYAHLRGRDGRVQLTAPDEMVDDYRVLAIEPGRVQLQRGTRMVWLEVPEVSRR